MCETETDNRASVCWECVGRTAHLPEDRQNRTVGKTKDLSSPGGQEKQRKPRRAAGTQLDKWCAQTPAVGIIVVKKY